VKNRKLFDSTRLKLSLKRKRSAGGVAVKALCAPGFPLYYVLRNLGWLKREKWWTTLSPRARRTHALRMVRERIAIFNEVKNWRKNQESAKMPTLKVAGMNAPGYCNKCGLCCEVASGMPDFPAPGVLPGLWREIFASGLGQGHRFCPFLWEDNGSGGGLCSIYPLRSNPCRLFEFEECDFFWKSPEPAELSNGRQILMLGLWLIKLVNPRKLPLRRTGTTAKRPKFQEFDRI
jgi:Fe-S-cluster containining protein